MGVYNSIILFSLVNPNTERPIVINSRGSLSTSTEKRQTWGRSLNVRDISVFNVYGPSDDPGVNDGPKEEQCP